jgi:glycosyltransferase involved in cell wall biosynthesis
MANKIISILRYEPLRKTLKENGKQEIDLFTWDNVAKKTLMVYKNTLYTKQGDFNDY